ncbi:translocation/assembly module TamB domain-containing protein [Methylocystis sp. ATCC 49242]|uniref:translocation/assembly module TamB domain-containing protein n=1 Tax=Methylocystis sp. ATCC 49242 TaxID=622637 RepID=UPI0001F86D25|nr:translocation/assembly module TamB domain-containing protein [Methylocystis sp. ATCC 49242]
MRLRLSRSRLVAGLAALLIVGAIGAAVTFLNSDRGGTTLAGMISRAVSSPDMTVEIGGVDGVASSSPTARDVTLSDRDGVWLRIDRVSAKWSPLALLALKLDVDRIDIGRVDVLRRPAPGTETQKKREQASGSWRPDLPIRVRLGEFSIGRVDLDKPVLDMAATLAVDGSAEIGGARHAARAKLVARRLDAPGTIAASADFSPADGKLQVRAAASEPEGGLIARLARLPGLPPVEIALDGDGTLDAFDAKLVARAGEAISAEGGVKVVRDGAARRVDLGLSARLAEMLPKEVAALFADATKVEGVAHLGDDGAIALDRLALSASAFRLDAAGRLAADGGIEGAAALHGAEAGAGSRFSARKFEGEANISGALTRPAARLRLQIEDADGPIGRVGKFDIVARAVADGDLADAAARLDIEADAQGDGLAFADAALSEAVGDKFGLTLRARASGAGDAEIGVAKIETGAGEASFTGRAGPHALDGKAHVSAPELRRFAGLAGRDLRGALTLAADLEGAPQEGRIAATLNGAISGPGVGVAALDGLLGRRLSLSGKLATLPDGGVSFDKLALRGDHVSAVVQGEATREKAAIDAKIDLPDLRPTGLPLSGRADVAAALSGSLAKPDVMLTATLRDAAANGRPIPKLTLQGEAHDVLGDLSALARLDGVIDGKPARGRVLAARAGEGWKIDDLDLAVGNATAKGALVLDGAGLARGRLAVAAPDLDDFSAFALQKLAGRVNANITLDAAGGGQDISVDAQGAGVRAQAASIERLTAKFSARDLYRRPLLDGEVSLDNARVGAETIGKARLLASPAGAGAAALDLTLDARGFNITGRGTLTPGERTRLDISQFSAQRAGRKIALTAPAVVTFHRGALDLQGVAVALGAGRLDVSGTVGDRLDLTARARAVPLSVASIVDPSLGLDGNLDAEARITGARAAPAGDWRVRVTKATAPQLRSNGLPALDVSASGRLANSRTTLAADITVGAASRLKVTGSAPLGAGALDLTVKGALDAALANTMLAANGQTAAGKATVDLRLTGPAASPIVGGSIAIADGAFNDPLNGVSLTRIAGRIEGRGHDLAIPGVTAQTKNGGQIALAGRVSVAPGSGMPGSLHVFAQNAQLASTDIVSSTGDLDLTISGALARAPKVAGRIKLDTMEVNVPDRLPANLKPLPGSTHIDARGFAAQMLALARKEKEKAARRSNFDVAVDLSVSAPDRVFVRGRGLDAEFGGEAKLTGTLQKPTVLGGFDLRRGRLQLLTQRIDITRGKLTFTGGFRPELDFMAETRAADITAKIGITGPAGSPTFTFSSSPEMPQDEVLSRLLFAKASGSLTPFQAVQLAAALAQYSGAATGVDAFEKMRKALGVDSLDIDAGGANGPTVGASRYIMDGVSVGVRTGSKPEQTSVNVGVDVTKGVRVQSETRVDGQTSAGVGVEWEY